MTVFVGTEAQVESPQLLPGIPDEITLYHISPKLPFKAIRVLSSVSRAWHHSIRTRQVYYARHCTHGTETCVLIKHLSVMSKWVISLYSVRDDLSYELPPIPHHERGTSGNSACVLLDGKVYVLGGNFSRGELRNTQAAFVLDLGGQWRWKQCASMLKQREDFACAAMDGHIYALGGWFSGKHVLESEVYDPKEDKWSFVRPMGSRRACHRAVTLGEEIFVHGGLTYDGPRELTRALGFDLQIYRPVRGDWRVVKSFQRRRLEIIFLAQGKFHTLYNDKMSVYDMDRHVWTDLHSQSLNVMEHVAAFWPLAILAVDDNELVAVMRWIDRKLSCQTCLARCRGFSSKNATIVGWEKAQCPLSLSESPNVRGLVMYRVQL